MGLPKTMDVEILERRTTTITIAEARRIAIERIRACCQLHGGTAIAHGELIYEQLVGAGDHSWFETVVVRPASDLDRAALNVIAALAAHASTA